MRLIELAPSAAASRFHLFFCRPSPCVMFYQPYNALDCTGRTFLMSSNRLFMAFWCRSFGSPLDSSSRSEDFYRLRRCQHCSEDECSRAPLEFIPELHSTVTSSFNLAFLLGYSRPGRN
jgi:hypothetical protein